MKQHTKKYLDYFNLTEGDFIPCEICFQRAVDIHHIDARGMGGDPKKEKDKIENLMAVCRTCHEKYGDKTNYKEQLRNLHLTYIRNKSTSSFIIDKKLPENNLE